MNLLKKCHILAAVAVMVLAGQAARAEPLLKQGDVVAICGDSITEQKIYSVLMEDYLMMCQPQLKLRVVQEGWSGERAGGFLSRIPIDVLPFNPTVATTCYGMNDGGYGPLNDQVGKTYHDSLKASVDAMRAAGVRSVVVGGPGCVDVDFYKRDPTTYNKTLGSLRDIAQSIAKEETLPFADVHQVMYTAMLKTKEKYGKDYAFAGGDGVHPTSSGHLAMAYAFLKAMDLDPNIGTITVDLATGQAQASDGHKILTTKDGEVSIESSRYPFCFPGEAKNAGSTRGTAEFVPFNDDLNRLTLIVKGIKTARAKVTWGITSREYAAADLEKGINLAADFLDNPFVEPFKAVEQKIAAKQAFETGLIKDTLMSMNKVLKQFPELKDPCDTINSRFMQRDAALVHDLPGLVVPVNHTIKIESIGQ